MWKKFIRFMTKPIGKRSTYVEPPIDPELKKYIRTEAMKAAFIMNNMPKF